MAPLHGAIMGAVRADGPRALRTEGKTPDGVDSVCWMASLTKAVVSVACLRLIERGLIAPDQPAQELVPQLADRPVLTGFAADGAPALRTAAAPITIRHLLTHTSGFCYPLWNAAAARYCEHAGVPPVASGLRASLDLPLMADPGTAWEYGVSTDWLGLVLEAVAGTTLDRVLADEVLEPLGMADTGFMPDATRMARALPMRRRAADGGLALMAFAPGAAPEFFGGGGGLWGTVPDYLRFLRMLLAGGTTPDGVRLLRQDTVLAMGQDQLAPMGVVMAPLLAGTASDPLGLSQAGVGWGLGFLIHAEPGPTGRSAGTMAWSGMANCYFWIDRARDVAGVFMTQILPFYDAEALAHAAAFERSVYADLGEGTAAC